MWDQKSIIILFILGCTTARVKSTAYKSIPDFSYPQNFTLEHFCNESTPAVIVQNVTVSNKTKRTMNMNITKVREDFNLTLLVIPKNQDSINNSNDCLERIDKDMDIHQYKETYTINQTGDLQFNYIFSGCYYVVMTNASGISWLSKPEFHYSNYSYTNTKVEYSKPEYSPAYGTESITLETTISIPLSCIKVAAEIYELNQTEVKNDSDPPVDLMQKWVFNQNNLTRNETGRAVAHNVLFNRYKMKNGELKLKWSNLTRGGRVYRLKFSRSNFMCICNHANSAELDTWRLLLSGVKFSMGIINEESNKPCNEQSIMNYVMDSLALILGITSALIVTYFIVKCNMNSNYLEQKAIIDLWLPHAQLSNGAKLKQILLIYANDSREFMEAMCSLRYSLKEKCECKIHDVYSPDDYPMVAKLCPHKWVKNLLIDGIKVVWVDTPQLRSYFNDKQMQQKSTDFRDAAIPFAIELVTGLLQNPTTQYCDHFVVRMEGFDVADGCEDDPLRVIAPHIRYCIPAQFPSLCEDLTKSLTTPMYKQILTV